ncbi:MAG: hypothetical protein DMD40_03715 [Gemmatimonadetes bacterium]|nr:MAG: hypothetical protein DMD40_03715 [Gemmatimonadota bacterium]
MSVDLLDRRVLGGVRFINAVTGLPVDRVLDVRAPNVQWIRNGSGDYVIALAPGLAAHTVAFAAPPAAPPIGSVTLTVTVRDPLGEYLPRRATITLPRDPDPTHAAQTGSLFSPVGVPLYLAPAASTAPGWALVRVTVLGGTPDDRLAGALLRVVQDVTGRVLARGLSDARGEALVPVPGIPVTTFGTGTGPVLATDVTASLQVFAPTQETDPSNPDQLETQPVLKSAPVQLSSGRSLYLSL